MSIFYAYSVFGFYLNGTVYDNLGNPLNASNVSVTIQNMSTRTTISINSTLTNESGSFNLSLTGDATYGYQLKIVHINSTWNNVDFVGQSLPSFPYSEFNSLSASLINLYLKQAGTINITVLNKSEAKTSNYSVQIKDTKLGYPISCEGASGDQYFCYVPKDRNYSLMIYPQPGSNEHFVPVSFNWNNFTSNTSYDIVDGNSATLSSYNHTTLILHKQFNVTEGFSRIVGYVNDSRYNMTWGNITIVPILLEPGNMIFMTYSTLPWNASAWREGGDQSDVYDAAAGSYNITVPYSSAETVNYLLLAIAANNSQIYGGYRNITLSSTVRSVNFTMYGLLGNGATINMTNASGQGSFIVNAKKQSFNLVNSSNESITSLSAHIETIVDYSNYNCTEFTFMEDLNGQGVATFYIPLLNITGFKEMNIYSQTYAPKIVTSRTVSQIISNSNITMKTFTPKGTSGSFTASSLNITAYRSNSSCNVPNPPSSCILRNFLFSEAQQNMFPIVVGGGAISLRMSYGSTSVHYSNVDLLASGPPDAEFDSTATTSTSSGFSSTMKFGSQGPKIYDFIITSIPYTAGSSSATGLNESAPVNITIPVFYDEGWTTPIWNATNGTNASALAANFSHYSGRTSEWQTLMGLVNCTTNVSEFNSTDPCYLDVSNDKIWLRLPHFSGTEPSVSGGVITATSTSTTTTTTTGGGSGAPTSEWIVPFYVSESNFKSGYTQNLGLKYAFNFKVGNETHYVGVINISVDSVKIKVTSTPQEAVMKVGEVKSFDVNSDGVYDVKVSINSIENNKARVNIIFTNESVPVVAAQVNTDVTGQVTNEEVEKTDDSVEIKEGINKGIILWISIIVLIVVLGLIVVLLIKSKNNKRHSWERMFKTR
ncbi:MAG TPA: carboxypeptidase-like regulatory domain-containing protein [Candidatus Paceibacterota bacterium]|nr:carboxypeptidase-like regulatory domain-containing protein [Candidatus Paceibacterota bacterium]